MRMDLYYHFNQVYYRSKEVKFQIKCYNHIDREKSTGTFSTIDKRGVKMLEKKLEEQLKLLKNSAELYDKGRIEEALNIAIRLRVLLYKDESLLEQLGQKKTIKLLSTFEDHSKNPILKNLDIKSSIPFLTSNGQRAFLSKTLRNEFIPTKDWLNETITTLENKPYSRIDIIKITAHKDGAAHIDINHQSLKPFITRSGEMTINENNKPVTKEISNHHYILLRQIAYEILHSKALFIVNGLNYKPMEEIKSYNEYLNEKGYFYQAIKLYEKAIDVNLNNATFAYNNMGNCLCQIGEDKEAIKSYEKSIEQDDNYIDPLWNLSLIHNKIKRYDLTIESYEKILKIDKHHNGANFNLKSTLNILTDLKDEVIEQYQNYRINKPKNLLYIDSLAHSLLKFNYIEEAENFYRYSLSINPNNIGHMNNLGYTLYKQEKYVDTNIIFNNIINFKTDKIDIIINILEFKLIKGFVGFEELLKNLSKENSLYYQVFKILFKLRNNDQVNDNIEKLIGNKVSKKMKLNYSEIEEWIVLKDIDKRILIILEKYFYKE